MFSSRFPKLSLLDDLLLCKMVWFWWIYHKRCFVLPVKLCSSRQPKAAVPNNSQPPLAWVSHQWLVVSWYEAAMPECTEVQLKIGQVWVRTMLLTLCYWAWECVVCMFFCKRSLYAIQMIPWKMHHVIKFTFQDCEVSDLEAVLC